MVAAPAIVVIHRSTPALRRLRLGNRCQRTDHGRNHEAGGDQIGDDPFIQVQVALVLSEVADVVALR